MDHATPFLLLQELLWQCSFLPKHQDLRSWPKQEEFTVTKWWSIYKSENLSYSNNMLSTAGLKGDSTKLSNNRITKKGAKFINPTLVMRGWKKDNNLSMLNKQIETAKCCLHYDCIWHYLFSVEWKDNWLEKNKLATWCWALKIADP